MSSKPNTSQASRSEVAAYLRAQAGPMHTAAEAQKQWAAPLQKMFDQANSGKIQVAALNARALGRQFGPLFRRSLEQAEKLVAPAPAIRCQEYSIRWLKALINAADAMSHAPEDGKDGAFLRDAHDYLDDARYAVKPLTELRQRLYEAAQGKAHTPAADKTS